MFTAVMIIAMVETLILLGMVSYFANEASKWRQTASVATESNGQLTAQLAEANEALRPLQFRAKQAESAITTIQDRSDDRSRRDAETIATLRRQLARQERIAAHVATNSDRQSKIGTTSNGAAR